MADEVAASSPEAARQVVGNFALNVPLEEGHIAYLRDAQLAIRLSRFGRWLRSYLVMLPSSERRVALRGACEELISDRDAFVRFLLLEPIGGLLHEALGNVRAAWGAALEINVLAATGAELNALLGSERLTQAPILDRAVLLGGDGREYARPIRIERINQELRLVEAGEVTPPLSAEQGSRQLFGLFPLPSVAGMTVDPFDLFVDEGIKPNEMAADLARLASGLGHLEQWDARSFRDVEQTLRRIVPSVHRVAVYSATSQVMTGRAVMSLNHSASAIAECLVHEAQHSKLAMLIDLCSVNNTPLITALDPDDLESPWRPDLRPVEGILHGCASFIAVAEYWAIGDSDLAAGVRDESVAHAWMRAHQVHRGAEIALSCGRLSDAGVELAAGFRGRAAGILGELRPSRRWATRVLTDPTRTWRSGRWTPPRSMC